METGRETTGETEVEMAWMGLIRMHTIPSGISLFAIAGTPHF
jgi:hypothetical protein